MALTDKTPLLAPAIVAFGRKLEMSDRTIAGLTALAFDEIYIDNAPDPTHTIMVTLVHMIVQRYRMDEDAHQALLHEVMTILDARD